MKYGSNTKDMEQFIERIKAITPEEVEKLGLAFGKVSAFKHKAAWDAAFDAGEDSSRLGIGDTACDEAWRALEHVGYRYLSWCAIYDAILALVAKDLISKENFDVLYGPWKQTMEVGE